MSSAKKRARRFKRDNPAPVDEYAEMTDGELAGDIVCRWGWGSTEYGNFYTWWISLPDRSQERLAGIVREWDRGNPPREWYDRFSK